MDRVLLIEDSEECQMIVSQALRGSVELDIADDMSKARRLLASDDYHLLLLDIGLPDGNGFGLCSTLVAELGANRPRIIFLTANYSITEKLTGFSVGGDDYVTKPFDPLELKARVMAHLRVKSEMSEAAQTISVGNLVLNLANYSAELQGNFGTSKIELTPMEFRLLYALAKNEGRILSREQLLSFASGHGEEVMDRTIDAHLSKVRKKLGSCSHSIEAVYGIGYRLVRL